MKSYEEKRGECEDKILEKIKKKDSKVQYPLRLLAYTLEPEREYSDFIMSFHNTMCIREKCAWWLICQELSDLSTNLKDLFWKTQSK